GGRAGAVVVAAARAAAGVPAAHVRGAHPVHRDGGRRGRPALAEDPAHRGLQRCADHEDRVVKARNAFAALVALVVIGLAACAGPTPATAEAAPALTPAVAAPTTAAPQAIRQQVEVTFYAAA